MTIARHADDEKHLHTYEEEEDIEVYGFNGSARRYA